MRIRGIGRLKAGLARLRGQLVPGPMVLIYHRVARLPQDPHLLAVTPEHFEEHLLAMRQHYEVISLSELCMHLTQGRRLGQAVVLTFDDGYADNAEIAMPLLKKHGIPATFYLASGFVGTAREYLQDDLERLLLLPSQCPAQVKLNVGDQSLVWDMQAMDDGGRVGSAAIKWDMLFKTDPTPRHRAHREIHNLLRTMLPAGREEALKQLRFQCGDPGSARPTHRAMSWDQTRQMVSSDLIELGVHTVNHPWLSSLSLEEQRAEILGSKRAIEEQIQKPISSFSYPYGSRQSYTAETIGILKEVDFTNACSNFNKRLGSGTDPFQIPRFIVRDWNGDEFLHQIGRNRL